MVWWHQLKVGFDDLGGFSQPEGFCAPQERGDGSFGRGPHPGLTLVTAVSQQR